MIQPPGKTSRVTQVAETLRRALATSEWDSHMPGEEALANQLQVSRNTLRRALALLRAEGLIEVSHGRRTRIVARKRHGRSMSTHLVAIVSPEPLSVVRDFAFYFEELRRRLQDQGFRLEFHSSPRLYGRRPSKWMETLVRDVKADCWVLLRSTRPIQQWFEQRRIPVVVDGTLHTGIELPSLDIDFRAVCRHAAGQLLALGHTRIAFLIPKSGAAGDLASEQGFREAFEKFKPGQAQPTIVRPEPSTDGVCAALDALFRSTAAPTGILVAYPWHAFTVLGHLARLGLHVPNDVSVISRADIPSLAYAIPSVARYIFNPRVYATRLVRMILQVVEKGAKCQGQNHVWPKHHKGESMSQRRDVPASAGLCK